ncbi:MAG: glycosyltransferase [Butyrivibrio sp.]|nr:glycosyltransferase [Butyrivibrio sp.]
MPLDNRKLFALARRILRMPSKKRGYTDIAPWDKNIIEVLSQQEDIELYVISAHTGMKKSFVDFQIGNVCYTFVRCDYATLFKRIIPNDDLWRYLNPMTPVVQRKVKEFNPDIVMLVGAENAYYSSTVIGLEKDFPVCVLTQTIYNNPDRSKYGNVDSKNATTELEIFHRIKHIGVYSDMHENLLRAIAPEADIFRFRFPSKGLPDIHYNGSKEYDFVNFAKGMSFNKGFHDSIKALSIVKQKYPKVKLNIVGSSTDDVRKEINDLIISLGLQDNITHTPTFKEQKDVLLHIQKSRFAVLPCKMDNISGTMTQSMFYGLPLVVYKTPGTPSLNKDKECVLIAEHSNVEDLAQKMLELMDNSEKAEMLRNNAKECILKRFKEEEGNAERLINELKRIISYYN